MTTVCIIYSSLKLLTVSSLVITSANEVMYLSWYVCASVSKITCKLWINFHDIFSRCFHYCKKQSIWVSVCQYQSSDWLWRPPPKWPILSGGALNSTHSLTVCVWLYVLSPGLHVQSFFSLWFVCQITLTFVHFSRLRELLALSTLTRFLTV